MRETSARLLRLLSLLQTRREWSGQELAGRLGVTARTVRRDVDKLRSLDYPVRSGKGIAGGYHLEAGAQLPPLQLDDEEAVALAIALRTASISGVTGVGETALRALVKLEQVLPARLRAQVRSMQPATVRTAAHTRAAVDPEVLTAVAAACRDRQRLRFDYLKPGGQSYRETEPHELVTWGPRWYLVAWDCDRADWRTFRVDRMRTKIPVGPRFSPRELPGGDAAAHVANGVAQLWPYRATIRLHVAADSEQARSVGSYGTVEPIDAQNCRLEIGADNPQALTFLLGAIDADFTIERGPELAEHLRRVSARFTRAVSESNEYQ